MGRDASARVRAACAAAGLGLALAVAPGCDDHDAAARAIESATRTMHAVSPSSRQHAAPSARQEAYRSIIASLRPHTEGGLPGQAAAASLLVSQAHAAIAADLAADVLLAERDAHNAASLVRAGLAQWVDAHARAAAAAFDPGPMQAEIERQRREQESAIERARRQKTDLEATIASMTAEADRLERLTAAERARVSELRERTATVSAREALDLMEEAAGHHRIADEHETAAAVVRAEIDRRRPELVEFDLAMASSLQRLRGLAEEARMLEARSAAASEARAAASEDARRAEHDISTLAGEYEAILTSRIRPATEAALTDYRAAVAAARRSVAGSRLSGNVALGSTLQSVGDLHDRRALLVEASAGLYDDLARAAPPLARSDAFSAAAEQARRDARGALDESIEAYNGAMSAFQGSGASGEARSTIERLSQALQRAIARRSDRAADLGASPPKGE